MPKTDKDIVELARPIISEIADERLAKLVDQKWERQLKTNQDIRDEVNKVREDVGDLHKKLDDLILVLDNVDTRTKQMKRDDAKTPELVAETIDDKLESVPHRIQKAVDKAIDKKPRIYIKPKSFLSRLLRR